MAPAKVQELTESVATRLRRLSKKELQRRDVFGRTIIHLVCIVGRYDLLNELLRNSNINVFVADYESGWTGLHCSIFYGKLSCARLLLDHKYELVKCKDRSGLTAMDLYYLKYSFQNLKINPTSIGKDDTNYTQRFDGADDFKIDDDETIWWDKDQRGGSDIYTFGSNINSQLGTGDSIDRSKVPYRVDIKNFRLDDVSLSIADRLVKPRPKTIVLSKNQSIILTNEHYNNLLISGSQVKGRLGNESLQQNFRFNHIDFFEDDHIVDVATCDDHSLALNSGGEVYSWGLNNFYQLGFATEKIKGRSDTYSREPKRVLHVLKKYKIQGISCSKNHSIAYTNNVLILWGLNVGQMSFVSTGEQIKAVKYKGIVQIPRDITFEHNIRQVIATDDSTIVLLDNNECHILTNGIRLKYQLPVFKALNDDFEHFRPSIFSKRKKIIKLVSKDRSMIGILYNDGSILGFGIDATTRGSAIKYTPVWTPRSSHLKCIDVDIGQDGSIIICTKSGCVYKRIPKNTRNNEYKFTKLERLTKIVKVACDSLFSSFGFIRDDVDLLPLQLEKNTFRQDIAYLSPLTPGITNKKQSELIDTVECNQYIVDFLHRPEADYQEDEFDMFQRDYLRTDQHSEEEGKDPLLKRYRDRWCKAQTLKSTFLPLSNDKFIELVQSEDLKYQLNTNDFISGKDYDLKFDVDDCSIGVHSEFLFSNIFFQQLKDTGSVIVDMEFDRINGNVIKVKNVQVHSLLIVLHCLYTGVALRPWEDFNKSDLPLYLKKTKNECTILFEQLKIGFEEASRKSKQEDLDFSGFTNDSTILLKDEEELKCCSLILRARCAYFETLFSNRWLDDSLNYLDFKHFSKTVFQIALDYIYGKEELSLWDKHTEIRSITEFINLEFDLIELSDELLLFGLKDLAQLMIKDFINQDNCLIILHHAEALNCQKLIGECLWFIYNNVDPFLTDPNYDELLSDQMITRIDKYCRWLNRVNKLNIHETKTSWLDGDSDELLNKFLNDDREFNDIFLERDDFVPLFDTKETSAPSVTEPETKNTAKSPSPPPLSTAEMDRKISCSSVSSQRRSSVYSDSEFALDTTEDEFQTVINSRRRRRSSNKRRTSSHHDTSPPIISGLRRSSDVKTPLKSTPIPIPAPFKAPFLSRNGSTSSVNSGLPNSIDKMQWPSIIGQDNLSPSSSASITSSNAAIKIPSPEPSQNDSKSSKGIWRSTSPLPKLSQKERKRLMRKEATTINFSGDKQKSQNESPWKIPETKVKPLSIAEAQEEVILVKRGVIEKGKYHDYQLNPQINKPHKSFAEIQQEQEFAAWWEEESRKVQTKINGWNNFTLNKSSRPRTNKSKEPIPTDSKNGKKTTPKKKKSFVEALATRK